MKYEFLNAIKYVVVELFDKKFDFIEFQCFIQLLVSQYIRIAVNANIISKMNRL